MNIRRLTVVAATALAALIMVPVAAAAKPPQLKATFGSGLTFDVKQGKKLLTSGSNGEITVRARKYRFVVKEDSTIHNYVLVNSKGKVIMGKRGKKKKKVRTSVAGTLKKPRTYVIRLKKGDYTLFCTPHRPAGMTVAFTVT